MSKIKTRESVKNVKVLGKATVASENMKKAFIRTKDQAQNLADDGQVSSNEYASDQLQYAAEDITQEVGNAATSGIQKAGTKGREAYQHHKAKQAEKAKAASDPAAAPKTKAAEQAKAKAAEQAKVVAEAPKVGADNPAPTPQELQTYYRGRTHARKSAKQAQETTHRTIKVAQRSERTIKQIAKSTGKASVETAKGTIKTSKKAVKTAEATSKATIKQLRLQLKPPRKRRRRLLKPHKLQHRRRAQLQKLLLLQPRL